MVVGKDVPGNNDDTFGLQHVAVFGILAFVGLHFLLDKQTHTELAAYQDVVKLPARSANVTITLP